MDGASKALLSVGKFSQLRIDSASFTPKFSRFRYFLYPFPPNFQHGKGTFDQTQTMDPFCDNSACLGPFFGCSQEGIMIVSYTIVQIIFPVRKLELD